MRIKRVLTKQRISFIVSLVVILLLITFFIPKIEKYSYQGDLVEFDLNNPDFSIVHQLCINGTFIRNHMFPDYFYGTFYLQDSPNLEEVILQAKFEHGYATGRNIWLVDSYGEPHVNNSTISGLLCDGNFSNLIVFFQSEEPQMSSTNFACLSSPSRAEALAQYHKMIHNSNYRAH